MNLQFAQKAVVTSGGRILLVRKSAEDPNRPGLWDLPGGRMKESESVDEHLAREVLEETGFVVTPGRPIDVWSWDMSLNGRNVRVLAVSRFCHLMEALPCGACREPDDYLSAQHWFPLADVEKIQIIPSQLPTIRVVLSEHWARDRGGLR
jgi:8-oxo-dGTP pyrophosphatase MutT (NUDIX family)